MSSVKSWQGTQTVNNLVVNGSLSVNDLKQLQSNNGLITAALKYPGDPTPTGIPTVSLFGLMRERPIKTQRVLEFRILHGNKSEFDAITQPTVAGVIPSVPVGETWAICVKSLVDTPTGPVITSAPASMTNGDIQLAVEKNLFMILERGTTATDFNAEFYYEEVNQPLSQIDPIQYGWRVEDVVSADITSMFDCFLGDQSTSPPEMLDASNFFRLASTSAL